MTRPETHQAAQGIPQQRPARANDGSGLHGRRDYGAPSAGLDTTGVAPDQRRLRHIMKIRHRTDGQPGDRVSHADRRISRDDCGQRRSRSATRVPEHEGSDRIDSFMNRAMAFRAVHRSPSHALLVLLIPALSEPTRRASGGRGHSREGQIADVAVLIVAEGSFDLGQVGQASVGGRLSHAERGILQEAADPGVLTRRQAKVRPQRAD